MPTGSGAPNEIRGRVRVALSAAISGSPAPSRAAAHASPTSRCARAGASADRATTRRQRWRGSATGAGWAGAGAGSAAGGSPCSGGRDTSASLPDDGPAGSAHSRRARTARLGPGDGVGQRAAPSPVRRSGFEPRRASVRTDLAARGCPDRGRDRRRHHPVDGPRRGPAVRRGPAAGVPARSTGALAGAPRRAPEPGDPHRLRHRDHRDRRVPQSHARAADQRDRPVPPGPAWARGSAAGPARPPLRGLRATGHTGRGPRLDRRDDRVDRPGSGWCTLLRPDLPPADPDGRHELRRCDLRLHPAPGLGVLPAQGPRRR